MTQFQSPSGQPPSPSHVTMSGAQPVFMAIWSASQSTECFMKFLLNPAFTSNFWQNPPIANNGFTSGPQQLLYVATLFTTIMTYDWGSLLDFKYIWSKNNFSTPKSCQISGLSTYIDKTSKLFNILYCIIWICIIAFSYMNIWGQ